VASHIGCRSVIVAFATIYAIWGSTYLAVALALQSVPPFLLVGTRSVAGGLILLAIERARGGTLPAAGAWLPASVGGLLLFVGCHGSLAYAQQYVPSGLTAVMIATVPFWFVLLDFVTPAGRRANVASLFRLVPGLAGVALIASRRVSPEANTVDPAMVLLLLGSALSWAAGSRVGQRRAISVSAIALAGMQLVCGGVILLAGSWLAGEWKEFTLGGVLPSAWAAFAYLTLAGSVTAYSAYVWLLDRVPGSLVTTYTFITPIIAIFLGWTFLGERLSGQMLLGTTLVIGSVILVWRLETESGGGKDVPDMSIAQKEGRPGATASCTR
jgi:drug/metabolite transporter (DMT)-like permease